MTQDTSYYSSQNAVSLPAKWLSPEAIQFHRFSPKSDVWAFGITLWELFSEGQVPYFQYSNKEAIEAVVHENYRLKQPNRCPHDIWPIIWGCWEKEPASRPNFANLVKQLAPFASSNNHRSPSQQLTAQQPDIYN